MLDNFLKWFSHTRLWVWIIKKILSKFTFRWNGYPSFPMEKYFVMLKAIEKCEQENGRGLYAFVSSDNKSLSAIAIRWFSKSYWTHAGVLVGKDRILHMKADGALYWHILEQMKETDSFALGRIELPTEALASIEKNIQLIINNISQFSYDFQVELDNGNNNFYCSELVYFLAKEFAINPLFVSRYVHGRKVFEPDDLYKAMTIIFEHRSE